MTDQKHTTIIVKQERRPCLVNGQKALFHCWENKAQVVAPSMLIGEGGGGIVRETFGIIEREDGTIHECYPYEIRFMDKEDIIDKEQLTKIAEMLGCKQEVNNG